MTTLSEKQIADYQRDGFLVLEEFLALDRLAALAARFEPLFGGAFPSGLHPDEWNWRAGRDSEDLTRQICNGWKADPVIAGVVLSATLGHCCAQLGGWPGARIGQDNVLWKPPGASALGFHQDDSYCQWVDPVGYVTCWMPLDRTTADGGTIEYVPGSHLWGEFPMIRQFHAPDDYTEALKEAARQVGKTPEIIKVELPAGGCAFHAGRTWHGSGANRSPRPRRSLVAHCISSEARFHASNVSYIYNRYKHRDSLTMDEDFFPILWTRDGYRSAWLDDYVEDV